MSKSSGKSGKAADRARKAAELRAQQARAERKRRLLMVGGVIAIFVLIVGGAIVVTLLNQDEVDAPAAGSGEFGVTIGDPEAPHEVIIYEDFLCPLCGQLEAASGDGLAEAAADGKVYVEYRPIAILTQFGDYSERSTNAFRVVLEESGPEVAKAFHDRLFEDQPEEGGDYPSNDELVDLAVDAGAAEGDVRPGIEGLAQKDWVADATDAAAQAGIEGTPTILLDGEPFQDGRDWADLGRNLVEAVQ